MVESLVKLSHDMMREYSPIAFWFWNAELDSKELQRQVKEMVEQGVYGGFMHPRPGMTTKYFSDEHWQLMKDTIDTARQYGFNAWLYDEFGWPSGTAGITDPQGTQTYSLVMRHGRKFWGKFLRVKMLFVSEGEEVELGSGIGADLELIAIRAVPVGSNGLPHFERQLDLLDKTGERWAASVDGCYIVEVYKGYDHKIIDYLNKDAVRCFIDVTHEEYLKRFGSEFGKSIPGVFFDEIFMASRYLPYTEGLLEEFARQNGYALIDHILALVQDCGSVSVKVRYDYFTLVSRLYEEAFFKQVTDWCEEHSLKLIGHTEESIDLHPWRQGHFFQTMRHVTIPCSDHHGFRYNHPRTVARHEVKLVTSVASQYGKDRIAVEGFGGAGWAVTLEELKNGTNLLATLGVDCFIMHGFYYSLDQPEAAEDYPNSWFFQNPYWEDFKSYSEYVARLSYMLAGAKHISEVGLVYPIESVWVNVQTDSWSLKPQGRSAIACFEKLVSKLCDSCTGFEVVDGDGIINGRVNAGAIEIGKSSFKYIICPSLDIITQDMALALCDFARSGGCVLFVTNVPDVFKTEKMLKSVLGLSEFVPELGALTNSESIRFGLGSIAFTSTETEAVEYIRRTHQPEFRIKPNATGIQYIHKKKDNRDIMFVANTSDMPSAFTIQSRCLGKWYLMFPEKGDFEEAIPDRSCSSPEGYIAEYSMELAPHCGVFIVVDVTAEVLDNIEQYKSENGYVRKRISLDGKWQFTIGSSKNCIDAECLNLYEVQIPVAQFVHETTSGSEISQVARLDEDSTGGPCVGNLLDDWDAYWISFRDARLPNARDESPFMSFKKDLTVRKDIKEASMDIAAMGRWTLFINGRKVSSGSGEKNAERVLLTEFVAPGSNSIVVVVENEHPKPLWDVVWMFEGREHRLTSLLAEMSLVYEDGAVEHMSSDKTWSVCCSNSPFCDDTRWSPAWERGRPPILPFGHIERVDSKPLYPARVTYNFALPIAAKGYTITASGKNVIFKITYSCGKQVVRTVDVLDGKFSDSLLEDQQGVTSVSMEMTVESPNEGLLAPVVVHCAPVVIPLKDWRELGLEWFSGRCTYQKRFDLRADDMGNKVMLKCKDVRHTARVYVNGQLAGSCLWQPYSLDISEYVIQGENVLQIEVANLLANEMLWKVDSRVKGVGWARYWHEDFTLRDTNRLTSGLLDSVTLEICG